MILRTGVILGLLITPVFVYSPRPSGVEGDTPINTITVTVDFPESATGAQGSILFVGDLMLGRRVESMAKEQSFAFPFASTTDLLMSTDITVGNLEGTVPDQHFHTPDLTYRFSFQEAALMALREAGINVLSLANNHSFDYGKTGYEETLAACVRTELKCFGNPNRVSTSSVERIRIGGIDGVLLMINATYGYPSLETIEAHLRAAHLTDDFIIAYIHWGDEYVLRHNEAQEKFAKLLIDNGVDAVIGHHPHVVQDIGLYRGKPIFYSLGNFVFDQYFSDEVQVGLAVKIHIEADTVTYELIPHSSRESRSQPRLADDMAAEVMWNRIVSDVWQNPFVRASNRTIVVPRFPGR